ncbi:response regulator [Sphingomonas kyeonggiensis]|uniref:FixJ family two-component response regulator n=1 Tax=Sphingomonas kyeonggiensis TaxID=1268553 RepID=A0A7W6NXJ8_9SPHN|nr:FixJ family two-component response regulator [Sphingomonas kyeonggiensis]
MTDPFPSPLVAVVDDDPGIRGSLNSLLRSAGLASVSFESAEALLADDPARFAWVITDLHMPGMTGLELQAEIGRRGCDCEMIVMTAFPTRASQSQALGAGARAFLTKPIDADLLLEAIEGAA